MGRFSVSFIFVIFAILFGSGTTHAIEKFAKLYKLSCETCHSKVPLLSDYGAKFLANGFILPGKEAQATRGDKGSLPKGTDGKVPGGGGGSAEVGAQAEEKPAATDKSSATGEQRTDGVQSAPAAPVEEPPPTVVYRVPSPDGSIYFTDNPIRVDSLRAMKSEPREKAAPTTAPLPAVTDQPTATRSAPVPGRGAKAAPASVRRPERFNSFAECMEHQLAGAPPPTTQEMTDLFVRAEETCAAFPKRSR